MKKFNTNWIGLGLLVVAWSFSAVRMAKISGEISSEEGENDGKKVIRLLHWQLEPGYRDGVDKIMQAYNELPHVKAANVEVRQLAVTERVYAQFLNVHLISGTAPDICEKGMSQILGTGAQLARFFEPISGYVKDPNPYNADEYLPQDEEISPELKKYLQESAWSETFTDGMLGGWDDSLQDYIAVPVSSWGAMRTFYNRDLVAEIKGWLAEKWDQEQQPAWLSDLITVDKLVTPDEAFVEWVHSPEVPDSLGRFMIFCEATLKFAAEKKIESLIPISASNYFSGTMVGSYIVPFTNQIAQKLDYDHNSAISHLEFIAGWQSGMWDFQDPALKDGFYDVVNWLSRYYPAGYLGLDREQAARRFTSQQAIFITTGGWDASTLFTGAEGKFNVGIIAAPMPIEGERWFEFSSGQPNEAESRLGAPMAVNKNSKNIKWAIDFLRYMTSFSANQTMNREAGWIPSVVGAQPTEEMIPFLPRTDGVKGSIRLDPNNVNIVKTIYQGKFPLYQTNEISYQEFVEAVEEGYRNERNGADRVWHESFVSTRDRSRQLERTMVVTRLRAEQDGWTGENLIKHNNIFEYSLGTLDGYSVQGDFRLFFPDKPFPSF
jgi:raffinose/stachyose/melibiose transport system substrate-binding protein